MSKRTEKAQAFKHGLDGSLPLQELPYDEVISGLKWPYFQKGCKLNKSYGCKNEIGCIQTVGFDIESFFLTKLQNGM